MIFFALTLHIGEDEDTKSFSFEYNKDSDNYSIQLNNESKK